MAEPHIQFRNASFFWQDRPILKRLDLSIPGNGLTWMTGNSGVGKTTLLKIAAGHLSLSSGMCLVDGSNVDGPSPKIAYVPQDYLLFHWLRLDDNVRYGAAVNPHRTPEDLRWFDGLLARLDLHDARKLWPSQLSGGMKQRAAILRALFLGAPTVILDEPFSAIDAQNTWRCLEILREYSERGYGRVLVSTHETALIEAERDPVVELVQASPDRDISAAWSDRWNRRQNLAGVSA